MTVVALLSVAPVKEGSMAEDVADTVAVLKNFDVSYETTPMRAVIGPDDVGTLFAACEAAHRTVGAVERALGRAARSDRE